MRFDEPKFKPDDKSSTLVLLALTFTRSTTMAKKGKGKKPVKK